jgi:hypothetical protein
MRMMTRQPTQPQAQNTRHRAATPPPHVNGNQARLHQIASRLQPKLEIGAVDDPLEREAEQVADNVMRMPDPVPGAPLVQRKCETCDQEEKIARKDTGSPVPAGTAPATVHAALLSPGRELDADTREFFEPRFGANFSGVRVYDDAEAANSARDIGARAYTLDRHIVFSQGAYQAGSAQGKRLIAHELAHVIQQSDQLGGSIKLRRNPGKQDTKPDPPGNAPTPAASAPVTWSNGPTFGPPLELPYDEAARRVNQAIDIMGQGFTYVKRPPAPSDIGVASASQTKKSDDQDPVIQTFPDTANPASISSVLAKIHGGVVGSLQFCYDCLTGESSLNGWLWAGIGYDAPFVGWLGAYYFGEKMWFKGNIGNWFTPGTCRPACNPSEKGDSEHGFGVAGFPIDIKPKERARFSKAGIEVGALLTPHSFCDYDIEIIALLDILRYIGPVAAVAKKAVEGINAVLKGKAHVELQAGIDFSVTFHLCRGEDRFLTLNHADLCAGGFVGAGIGLGHEKSDNHGAT